MTTELAIFHLDSIYQELAEYSNKCEKRGALIPMDVYAAKAEAVKRLTDAGVLVPCCCGREAHIKKRDKIISYKVCCESISCGNETMWWPDEGTAIRVWNTRAPILSAKEMEILEHA